MRNFVAIDSVRIAMHWIDYKFFYLGSCSLLYDIVDRYSSSFYDLTC